MVREAQRAGLQFDETKLQALNCGHPETLFPKPGGPCQQTPAQIPTIEIDPASPAPVASERDVSPFAQPADEDAVSEKHDRLSSSSTQPEYHTKFYKYVVLLLQSSLVLEK